MLFGLLIDSYLTKMVARSRGRNWHQLSPRHRSVSWRPFYS